MRIFLVFLALFPLFLSGQVEPSFQTLTITVHFLASFLFCFGCCSFGGYDYFFLQIIIFFTSVKQDVKQVSETNMLTSQG